MLGLLRNGAVGFIDWLGLFFSTSNKPTFLPAPPIRPVQRNERREDCDGCCPDPAVRLRQKQPPSLKNETRCTRVPHYEAELPNDGVSSVNPVKCERKQSGVRKRKQPTITVPICNDGPGVVSIDRLDATDCRGERENYTSEQKPEQDCHRPNETELSHRWRR